MIIHVSENLIDRRIIRPVCFCICDEIGISVIGSCDKEIERIGHGHQNLLGVFFPAGVFHDHHFQQWSDFRNIPEGKVQILVGILFRFRINEEMKEGVVRRKGLQEAAEEYFSADQNADNRGFHMFNGTQRVTGKWLTDIAFSLMNGDEIGFQIR